MRTHCSQIISTFAVRALLLCFVLCLSSCSGGQSRQPPPPSADPTTFAVPRTIAVQLGPYSSAEEALGDQGAINWNTDGARAQAITLAYAAIELQRHLALASISVQITSTAAAGQSAIVLSVSDRDGDVIGEQGYTIEPRGNQVHVTARTRVGVLNGAYRLLEHLGFAWDDPYETHVPPQLGPLTRITWPTVRERPRIQRRGFWIYGPQTLPDEFAIWMARNRYNIGGKARVSLANLLGFYMWQGDHDLLQQEFSRPGLFEAHPQWYAMIAGERRPIPASGPYFNPAFGNTDAANYFAQRMLERLTAGDLQGVDVLNVWPADDRGNAFDQSAEARALGNETDNLLHFYAVLCRALREAHVAGRLQRPVTVAGISYFLTMRPPTNAAVAAQIDGADYLHIFYPIQRSWSGAFDAQLADRDTNRQLLAQLRDWDAFADVESGVVEYHNLSAYGAVALSDFPFLAANYATLTSGRSGLFAYMHPLLTNPGPRRLTNALLSRLAWRSGSADLSFEAEQITQAYFSRRYGQHAAQWREVYELMAQSVENAREMFGMDSLFWVLFQEQIWSPPPYSRADANAFIARYRAGGAQDLPGGYSAGTPFREVFRGLDESVAIQRRAMDQWQAALAGPVSADVRARMVADVVWFSATASRYRLTAATCDYMLAAAGSPERAAARTRMEQEIAFLETSPVTRDTISPVDQGAFLDFHRTLLAP